MAKGKKTGGRKAGVPNKLTADARAAVTEAFQRIGDVTALAAWAKDNPEAFYTRVWARTIPKELEHTGNPDKPVGVTLRFGNMEIPL